MKAKRDIAEEARRLEQLGHQLWEKHRLQSNNSNSTAGGESRSASRVIHRFPASAVTEYSSDDGSSEVGEMHRIARCIEVELGHDKPLYTLVEEDFLADPAEGLELISAAPVTRTDSVFHALALGYEMVEEDRLNESLVPVVERLEEVGFCEGMGAAVEEIEALVGAGELSAGARLRAKGEILAFLEGRLDRGAFITAAIDRWQQSAEEREIMKTREIERLVIDQP